MSEQSVTDLMMSRFKKKVAKGGINGPFQEAVAQVKKAIPDQVDRVKDRKTGEIKEIPFTFGRWCGYLKGISPYDILEMLRFAKKSGFTSKHFNWQVKELRKKQFKNK